MLKDLNPTTRCYPRRLSDAFQDKVENSQWFYPPEKHRGFWSYLLTSLGACMWACLIVYFTVLI